MNQITPKTEYAAKQNEATPQSPRTDAVGTKNVKKNTGSASAEPTAPVAPEGRAADLMSARNPAQGRAKPAPETLYASDTERPAEPRRPGLTEVDARMLQHVLARGEGALARRSDMADLYTHVVKLFETLNQGVGQMYVAKAEQDRSALSARIDGLEEAVNRMEGALRIEFEPVLRAAMADVLAQQMPVRPKRGRTVWTVLALVAALTAGAVFHAQLAAIVSNTETQFSAIMTKFR